MDLPGPGFCPAHPDVAPVAAEQPPCCTRELELHCPACCLDPLRPFLRRIMWVESLLRSMGLLPPA